MREPERLTAFVSFDLSMIRPTDLKDHRFIDWVRACLQSSIVDRHGIIDAQRIEVQLGERGAAGDRIVMEEFARTAEPPDALVLGWRIAERLLGPAEPHPEPPAVQNRALAWKASNE
jgi:hypothetical protein